jgi:putative two-component system response regulator
MKNEPKKSFPHFILVDDDLYALQLTSKLIRNFSRRAGITTFSTAQAALEFMETRDFINQESDTVLLTDLHMPEMDGFALLERLDSIFKVMNGRLHIFVLSAEACPVEINRVFSYGYVIGFLDKPLSNLKMGQVINCVRYPI